jgi:flavin-dependent dehydrogenase
MRPIRILGAGPAGLTAALTLVGGHRAVEVYERRSDCGARFSGDLQGLENWSESQDILAELGEMSIAPNYFCAPFSRVVQTNGFKTDELSFDRPLFYLVKRGVNPDSLDQGLKRQAQAAGVVFHFNQTLSPESADIIATGPRGRPIFAVGKGIVFRTDAPDMAIALMNDEAALKGYSYLLITRGYGCLSTATFDDFSTARKRLESARTILIDGLALRITDPRPVGGIGHFSCRPRFQVGSTLYVGEAAGLQDLLWGFGIRSAMRSGYLAAKCLLEGRDYSQAAAALFGRQMKASLVNRFLWETLRHGHYRILMAALKRGGPIAIMRSFYRYNPLQQVLYPFARLFIRRRYRRIEA